VNRDTVIYSSCTFLLGLVLGSLVIGPRFASKQQTTAAEPPAAQQGPMQEVFKQIATLKGTIERDPKNVDALVQLGRMYMDAVKYQEAIGYFERAVAIRDDPNVRMDLGICLKEAGQPEKALVEFRRARELSPEQWQPMYNEAIVLGEMRRTDEAKAVAAKLQKMRPDDPDVQRLVAALGGLTP
jgi:Flp pilus assembly protein TadD